MMLLMDIGNTRVKWTQCRQGKLDASQASPHADWTAAQFEHTVLKDCARPDSVVVSNVGGERLADMVRESVHRVWRMEPQFVTSTAAACGVRNAYPTPQHLGVDRWLGLIAARARSPQLTCIAGVGTAMTIDAIDANGQHLGGVIVPGPDLMVSSLFRSTSDIEQRAARGQVQAALFADNTLGAVRQGAAHALAALIERAMHTLRQEHGTNPALLVTGGAAAAIAPLVQFAHQQINDLVLEGLAAYAQGLPAQGVVEPRV